MVAGGRIGEVLIKVVLSVLWLAFQKAEATAWVGQ